MPAHDAYLLHVYRSRAVSGWQWSARLERLPGGESQRFSDPEALLTYLRTVLRSGDPADLSSGALPAAMGEGETRATAPPPDDGATAQE